MSKIDSMRDYEVFRSALIKYLKKLPPGRKLEAYGHSNGGRLIVEFALDKRNEYWMEKEAKN